MCCFVNGSACFVCCELLGEIIHNMLCLGLFAILLLNVMDLLSVVGGALLDRPCMIFQRICVFCL